jgi:GTPase
MRATEVGLCRVSPLGATLPATAGTPRGSGRGIRPNGGRAASLRSPVPIPRIAIIGRPNVGKSSLLNMIAQDKVSIVDPTPGTTRDRVSVIVELPHPDGGPARPVEITDTGGYGVYAAEGQQVNEVGVDLSALTDDIEEQIAEAVRSADLILFCIDAQAGITPQDKVIARMLREGKLGGDARQRRIDGATERRRDQATKGAKRGPRPSSLHRSVAPSLPPIRLVATKVDGPRWEAHGHEISALGFGEPLLVSAKNNYFRREFLDALYGLVPEDTGGAPVPPVDLKLAIIGKRNAGKSSLVNALAGQKRVIVSEIAGTTRDAVDVRIELDGKSLLAIDTAGLRRKKSFANRIEHFAFDRVKRAIDRADVVFLLVDATEPLSQVDEQLAMLVQKTYKPVVIIVNKWDLAEGRTSDKGKRITTGDYEEYLRKELKGLTFAPISFVSAGTGLNLRPTIRLALDILDQARERVGTGKLNRLIQGILETSNPPSKLGTRAKVLYVAQVADHPPTIVLVVNRPELFTANYQRFLLNRFREELPYAEVPIRLLVRGRKRTRTGGIDPVEEPLSKAEAQEAEHEALARTTGDDAEAYFDEPA